MTSGASTSSDDQSASRSASPNEQLLAEEDAQQSPKEVGDEAVDGDDAEGTPESDQSNHETSDGVVQASTQGASAATTTAVEAAPVAPVVPPSGTAATSEPPPSSASADGAAANAATSAPPVSVPLPAALATQTPSAESPTTAPASNYNTNGPGAARGADNGHATAAAAHGIPAHLPQAVVDGRVRNATPSKLQGKTKDTDGNFSVMHMDVQKGLVSARSLAAQRTSELTRQAAEAATRDGYQSVKRTRLVWRPPIARGPPPGQSGQPTYQGAHQMMHHPPYQSHPGHPQYPNYPPHPYYSHHPNHPQHPDSPQHHGQPQHQSQPQPPQPPQQPSQPSQPSQPVSLGPSPADVKVEQARLLTFLRSLHPVLVVDQLCKALAYFGGIPSAPPPENGEFPGSAKNNGSGSLFVGWMSEIFPPAGQTPLPTPGVVGGPVAGSSNGTSTGLGGDQDPRTNILLPRRKRGRPKGSKGSKARKDKGIKKGPKNPDATDGGEEEEATAEEQDNAVEEQNTGAQETNTEVTSANQPIDVDALPRSTPPPASGEASNAATASDANQLETPTSIGKKRGRPPGSKNRPRRDVTAHAMQAQTVSTRPPPLITGLNGPVQFANLSPTAQRAAATQAPETSRFELAQVAETEQLPHHEGGLSQHARIWGQPPVPDASGQAQMRSEAGPNATVPAAASRKRKADEDPRSQPPRDTLQSQPAAPSTQASAMQPRTDATTTAPIQAAAAAKRRRISKEANPHISTRVTGSQASGLDMSASPTAPQRQPTSATSTQSPVNLNNHSSGNTPTNAQAPQPPAQAPQQSSAVQAWPRKQLPQTTLSTGHAQREQAQQAPQNQQQQQQHQRVSPAQQKQQYPPYYNPQSQSQTHTQLRAGRVPQQQSPTAYSPSLQTAGGRRRPIMGGGVPSASQPYPRPASASSTSTSSFASGNRPPPAANSGSGYQQPPYTRQQAPSQQQQQQARWGEAEYPMDARGGAAAAAATLGNQVRGNPDFYNGAYRRS